MDILVNDRSDSETMINTLLDKGADISAKDDEGNTAVHILSMQGRRKEYACMHDQYRWTMYITT